ncbi:MAG TPA: membrane protein insertion efficiency factor YidD [Acidimicrobiales bacterium]|nr:membrane protein insertion efficiency factor YidD [Acidimicrobiales bacterium]
MTNSPTTSARPSPARASSADRALIAMVRAYQRLSANRVAPCRFYPSCSAYALEAVETHGAARGGWLALRRLSKCRPFGPHGVDLVPPATGGAA